MLSLPLDKIDSLLNTLLPWDILGLSQFGKRLIIRLGSAIAISGLLIAYLLSIRVDLSIPINLATLIGG